MRSNPISEGLKIFDPSIRLNIENIKGGVLLKRSDAYLENYAGLCRQADALSPELLENTMYREGFVTKMETVLSPD